MAQEKDLPPVNGSLNDPDLTERLGRVGSWYADTPGDTVWLTAGAARLLGLDGATGLARDALLARFREKDRPAIAATLTGQANGAEGMLEDRGEACHVLRWTRDGSLAAGIVADISDSGNLSAQLDEARQRHRHFESMAEDWLWEMDADLRFSYISENVEKIVGVPVSFHIGKTRRELVAERNVELDMEMEMHLAWLDQRKPFRDFRYWRAGPDGKDQYLSVTGEPIFDADGVFQGYRGTGRDMTGEQQIREALLQVNRQLYAANKAKSDAMGSLKEANALLEERNLDMRRVQKEIRHSAMHDALTGLANRRYLDERMTRGVAQCRATGAEMGVLHVDLDRFKQINDTLGHAAGDAVLRHVADTLRKVAGNEDFTARVGGDEFVIVSIGKGEDVLRVMAEDIIAILGRPMVFEERECWFGASVGIALAAGGEIDARQLLANADVALYRAKRAGRGCVEVFTEAFQLELLRQRDLTDGIQAGLDRGEFVPWYQPQVSAEDFTICGLEALARWCPPDGTIRTPFDFLDAAEELNKVQVIDRMILERALGDLAIWDCGGVRVPRLSVNVSARRLLEPDLAETIRELDPPAGRLAFELLESVFLDEVDQTISWNIDTLKEMGIAIELDDFGSGHASIISLVKMAPDAIKIDRQMTSAITEDASRRALAQAIVGIGKSLRVRVVAEGVETLDQALLLRELGCDVLQGFLFARPMPAEQIAPFIADWRDPRELPRTGTG